MKLPKALTTLEIIGIAIQSETEAIRFYRRIKNAVRSPALNNKLFFLINEEQKHQRALNEYYRHRFGGITMSRPDSSLVLKPSVPKGRLTVSILLKSAMKAESESEQFYLDATAIVSDVQGTLLFKYLAKVENSHYQLLKQELELIEQSAKIKEMKSLYQTDKYIHLGP
ncbi:MAG: ferritin family protein [Candidatus Brocadiia bacterium]